MFMTFGLDGKDTAESVETYIEAGVEEFFGGFIPKEWLEKYGWEVCPNRRPMGTGFNFHGRDELESVVKAVHSHGKRINLAVNSHDNGLERLGALRRTVEIMEEYEPDGYIVADPSVMASMVKWGIERPLHISTGAGCFNSEAVRFFCEHFNVRRVVIPRKLSLDEMRRMLEKLSDLDVEFEVMIIGYRCYFNDEDCHSIHSGARRNLCGEMHMSQYIANNRFPDGWKDALVEMATKTGAELLGSRVLNDFCEKWRNGEPSAPSFGGYRASNGIQSSMMHAILQNCGLCAIKELREMGVHALKVPLRGHGLNKLFPLKLVHDIMVHPNPTPEVCRRLVNSDAFCDELVNCYYRIPQAHACRKEG